MFRTLSSPEPEYDGVATSEVAQLAVVATCLESIVGLGSGSVGLSESLGQRYGRWRLTGLV